MSQKIATLYLKKIIFLGVFLSLLTPLIINSNLIFHFNSPRAIFFMLMAQVVFFAWLILITFNKEYRPQFNLVTIFLTLFVGSLTLSTIFSVDFITNFWSNQERSMGLLMHLHLYGFFLAVSSTFRGERDWIKVLGFSCFVASAVSLIGIFDNFNIVSFATYFSRGSLLGNTSFMGSYLLVNVFFGFYALMRTVGNWRIFYAINFLVVTFGVILNPGGRAMKGALLAGVIVFIILYLAFVYRQKIINNLSKVAILLGVVLFIFVGIMTFQEGSIVREEVSNLHGMIGRLTVWEKSWEGFKEKPFLGWGPESFEIAFLKNFDPEMYLESHGQEVWFDRAHNIVFDKLVGSGLIGTFLFFGIFGAALFVLWRKYMKKQEIDFLIPLVFSSLFIAHFIQNLTVFDMISSYMLIFLSFAFISSLCYKEREEKTKKEFNYLSLVVLIPFFFSYTYFIAQPYETSFLARRAFAIKETTEEKINYSKKTLESSCFGVRQIRRRFAERFLTQHKKEIQEIKDKEKLEKRKSLIKEKFQFIENELYINIEESPYNFKDFFLMGRLHNDYFDFHYLGSLIEIYIKRQGNFEKEDEEFFKEVEKWLDQSQNYFERGLDLSPLNLQGYWHCTQTIINKGKLEALKGNEEKATEKFEKAFKMAKNTIEFEPKVNHSHSLAIRIAEELLKDKEIVNELKESMSEIESLKN